MALNPKQAAFCREFLTAPNATVAAERAGYSAHTARSQGSRLLTNADILAEIARLRGQVNSVAVVDAAYVLTRLRENVERAMTAEAVKDGDGNPTGEYRYEGAVANRALELLGKHLGLFAERHEHTGKDGGPIQLTTEQRAEAVAGILAQAAARLKTQQGAGDGVDDDAAG